MKRSEQYRQMAQDVANFRDAYKSVLVHMQPVRENMMNAVVAYQPKAGASGAVADASQKTSQLAGRAKRAQLQSGISRTFVVPSVGIPIDPITAWDHSLRDVEAMPPGQVVNTCNLVIGALEEKADRADKTDRTLVGRLALLAALPARVRTIVAEDHPSLGRIGFATGIFAQIVVAVASGLILAGATVGINVLWSKVAKSTPAPKSSPSIAPTTPPAASPTPNASLTTARN
ncbi:hypothetical protein [Micromonospora sp. NPDC049359]|uniref:hypothetical protein n=1 Tax=Micromonospora sp. NPDC049359 TaxID=3364270 RepID=UPI0037B3E47A